MKKCLIYFAIAMSKCLGAVAKVKLILLPAGQGSICKEIPRVKKGVLGKWRRIHFGGI